MDATVCGRRRVRERRVAEPGVHMCGAEHGARTAGRGPTPARVYGSLRRRTAKRGVRRCALERESATGIVAC
jgi:hypothetical protein